MPRGVPINGQRQYTGKWSKFNPESPRFDPNAGTGFQSKPILTGAQNPLLQPAPDRPEETDCQIAKRIDAKFGVYTKMVERMTHQKLRSMVVSGDPGVGKSYEALQVLQDYDPSGSRYNVVKGFSRATGLYQSLYRAQEPGQITIFDDCDSVFSDAIGLNILKAACDSTERRTISWGALTKMQTDDGEEMPTNFDFDGHVIFITNIDFDRIIRQGGSMAEHCRALQSRSYYVDLGIHNRRTSLVRIQQVVGRGMLKHLAPEQIQSVLDYMAEKRDVLRDLDLRTALKLGELIQDDTDNEWREMADNTLLNERLIC